MIIRIKGVVHNDQGKITIVSEVDISAETEEPEKIADTYLKIEEILKNRNVKD